MGLWGSIRSLFSPASRREEGAPVSSGAAAPSAVRLGGSPVMVGGGLQAMQIATDNANDLLQDLTIMYNKSRQQVITNELLDIVSGSMA